MNIWHMNIYLPDKCQFLTHPNYAFFVPIMCAKARPRSGCASNRKALPRLGGPSSARPGRPHLGVDPKKRVNGWDLPWPDVTNMWEIDGNLGTWFWKMVETWMIQLVNDWKRLEHFRTYGCLLSSWPIAEQLYGAKRQLQAIFRLQE
jgi:hypothetical protein